MFDCSASGAIPNSGCMLTPGVQALLRSVDLISLISLDRKRTEDSGSVDSGVLDRIGS